MSATTIRPGRVQTRAMDVDQIRDGMKGDEGDAERQEAHGFQAQHADAEQPLHAVDEEVEILERPEHGEVRYNTERRGSGSRPPTRPVDHDRHRVVHRDDDQQNEYEPGLAPRVENEGGQQQKDVFRRDAREEEVDRQEYREKIEQECDGRKNHARAPQTGAASYQSRPQPALASRAGQARESGQP
jgi:hypothetical protein